MNKFQTASISFMSEIENIKQAKKELYDQFHKQVFLEDCFLSHGISKKDGKFCISLTVTKDGGVPESQFSVFEKMLPSIWQGYPVTLRFGDFPRAL